MTIFAPEGLYPLSIPTAEELRRAAGGEEIFQAMCIKCNEYHDLLVELGGVRGLIPRQEAACAMGGTAVREIAVLSRVGKPVAFRVLGFRADGTVLLSRKAAQLAAREHLLSTLRPGDILPAVVQSLASFGAFCDIGCGFVALMSIDRCSVSRISHCNQRFRPGQKIYAAVLAVEGQRVELTHRELLGTWAQNAEQFRPGQTVTGIVRGSQSYGTFIELTPNLSGLAEPGEKLEPGQPVSVYIRSIQPDRQKIKLTVLEKLPPMTDMGPIRYFCTSGHLSRWEYGPGSKNVTRFSP